MEAVFWPEFFWIFSGDFRLASCSFRQEMRINHRKKSKKFSGWNTASMFHHFHEAQPCPTLIAPLANTICKINEKIC